MEGVPMAESVVREPIQKRSIEKKEKIIKYGFDLICEKGYYNTNTAEIAKAAGVSTGIVYSYFTDKHDILLEGLKIYGNDIFYTSIDFIKQTKITKDNLPGIVRKVITEFIKNHTLSQTAHEEITAMIHSDKDVAFYFYKREMELTNTISTILINNNFKIQNMEEKVHIIVGLVDNLCHEIVYHKHSELDYNAMTDIITNEIVSLLTK